MPHQQLACLRAASSAHTSVQCNLAVKAETYHLSCLTEPVRQVLAARQCPVSVWPDAYCSRWLLLHMMGILKLTVRVILRIDRAVTTIDIAADLDVRFHLPEVQ